MNVWSTKVQGVMIACLLVLGILIGPGCAGPTTARVSQAPLGETNWVDETALDRLKPNDAVSISFTGIPNPPPSHDERINEHGEITLHLIGTITAAGKTRAQLQNEIYTNYVPKYFQRLTVTVQTENRFFFVSGEVKNPSRLVYAGGMTVLKAITAAGDFTDFAEKKQVQLTREDGRKFIINVNKARKNPAALDLPVVPGDVIFVPRRVF
jgi:polysaccharide export outer membrane protein